MVPIILRVSPPPVFVVLCTVASEKEGRALAGALVERGQAACVNLLPAVRSFFRWKGEICDETEQLLKLRCDLRSVDTESCKLSNSMFTGRFEIRGNTIVCIPDSSDPGLQLYDVSFRDVNRDGVMDAILSVGEVRTGGSAPSGWFQFVITRNEPEAPLVRLDGHTPN